MFIGYLKVRLFIPHSRSLKEKRRVVSSVKHRVSNKFNVSVAEKPSDKWQTSELSFVCVNYTQQYVHTALTKIEEFLRFNNGVNIVNSEKEII